MKIILCKMRYVLVVKRLQQFGKSSQIPRVDRTTLEETKAASAYGTQELFCIHMLSAIMVQHYDRHLAVFEPPRVLSHILICSHKLQSLVYLHPDVLKAKPSHSFGLLRAKQTGPMKVYSLPEVKDIHIG